MSLDPSAAPRPLPRIPCPTFEGRSMRWDRWEKAPAVTHIDQSCDACAFPGPLRMAMGVAQPTDGETIDLTVAAPRKRGERRTWGQRQVKAWPVLKLVANLCPQCFTIRLFAPDGGTVCELLCDGCDRYSAAGSTWVEARANLATLGGWSSPEADWDLCRECNPNAPEGLRLVGGSPA